MALCFLSKNCVACFATNKFMILLLGVVVVVVVFSFFIKMINGNENRQLWMVMTPLRSSQGSVFVSRAVSQQEWRTPRSCSLATNDATSTAPLNAFKGRASWQLINVIDLRFVSV